MGSLSQLEARSRHSPLLALWLLLKLMLMLMLPILPMAMDTPMPMLESPLVPALVLTQSPRDLTLSPRELLFHTLDIMDMLVTTLARGLLMLMPTMVLILMLPLLPMLLLSLLAQALVLTPSPRVLMLSPRELLFHTLDTMDMLVTTLARGLLMLMPTMLPILMHMLEFPLDPAQVLTPSPRVLMLQPRDMLPTMDMDTTHLASKLEDIF